MSLVETILVVLVEEPEAPFITSLVLNRINYGHNYTNEH